MSTLITRGPISHVFGVEEVLGLVENLSRDLPVFFAVAASGDHVIYRVSGQLRPLLACLWVWLVMGVLWIMDRYW